MEQDVQMKDRIRNILLESISGDSQSNLNDAFWEWFGDSKVINSDGSPRVVYHKTGSRFRSFNLKKTAQGIIWLTTDRAGLESGDIYTQGSGVIMELYAKVERPAGWKEYHNLMLDQIRRESDGVILDGDGGHYDIIIFEPTQIKSVSNQGTWNANDKRIMK